MTFIIIHTYIYIGKHLSNDVRFNVDTVAECAASRIWSAFYTSLDIIHLPLYATDPRIPPKTLRHPENSDFPVDKRPGVCFPRANKWPVLGTARTFIHALYINTARIHTDTAHDNMQYRGEGIYGGGGEKSPRYN